MQQRAGDLPAAAGNGASGSRTATASPATAGGANGPAAASTAHAASASTTTAYKPLNVKDALSYLDQVRRSCGNLKHGADGAEHTAPGQAPVPAAATDL